MNSHAVSPDLTLFVGVDPKVAATRRAVRGGPAELFEADEAQRRIAIQYLKAIELRENHERIVHIDGELSVEAVTEACLVEVRQVLARKR